MQKPTKKKNRNAAKGPKDFILKPICDFVKVNARLNANDMPIITVCFPLPSLHWL